VIEGKGPGIDDVTALDFIDGKEFFRNETTTKGPFSAAGQAEHDHHHGAEVELRAHDRRPSDFRLEGGFKPDRGNGGL